MALLDKESRQASGPLVGSPFTSLQCNPHGLMLDVPPLCTVQGRDMRAALCLRQWMA